MLNPQPNQKPTLIEKLSLWKALRDDPDVSEAQKKKLSKLIREGTAQLIEEQEQAEQQAKDDLEARARSEASAFEARKRNQARCKHVKFNKTNGQRETMLAGQYLQVPRVLFLFCQDEECGKEFSRPASPEHGWEEPPPELIPPEEELGGVMELRPSAEPVQKEQAA